MNHRDHPRWDDPDGAILFDRCDGCEQAATEPHRYLDAETAAVVLDPDREPVTVAEARLVGLVKWARRYEAVA